MGYALLIVIVLFVMIFFVGFLSGMLSERKVYTETEKRTNVLELEREKKDLAEELLICEDCKEHVDGVEWNDAPTPERCNCGKVRKTT